MPLSQFVQNIQNNQETSFNETIRIITEYYDYTPAEFTNGLGEKKITNVPSSNEGSCKIFYFAKINKLNQQQTLNLFGDYYHKDVLGVPAGNDHQNIRNFIQFGWKGIHFNSVALKAK